MSTDRFGRRVDYLRISVTDRCNMRCSYCMPADVTTVRPHPDALTDEQIVRIAAVALTEGVSKIRITGGEPLLRPGLPGLVGRLVDLAGPESVALTTNATLLRRSAWPLADAGLARVNISLDSLDPERFARVTGGGRLDEALDGLQAALETGLAPVKVNVAATAGIVDEIDAFLTLAAEQPIHVRFIERMPIGQSCSAAHDEAALTADEVVALIALRAEATGLGPPMPATDAERPAGWGPARYYRLPRARGTIGVIAPISRHFCATCNRLRLTADASLRPCLFSEQEIPLHAALEQPGDEALRAALRAAVAIRPAGHGLLADDPAPGAPPRRFMHQIGG